MLHETARGALSRILGECRRLLRPGGLMLHLEIPRGRTVLENFLYNWESWNNNETFGQYMTHLDLAALAREQGFAADAVRVADHAVKRDPEQRLYAEETAWKVLVGRR
jgi:ubiquinone/menaquinone biosynthesis C-methylase UbiE